MLLNAILHFNIFYACKTFYCFSNFAQLKEVVLAGMVVSSPGEKNEMKELVPNLQTLDLSKTLLSSWIDIIEICEQLSNLSSLIIS